MYILILSTTMNFLALSTSLIGIIGFATYFKYCASSEYTMYSNIPSFDQLTEIDKRKKTKVYIYSTLTTKKPIIYKDQKGNQQNYLLMSYKVKKITYHFVHMPFSNFPFVWKYPLNVLNTLILMQNIMILK
jgi:hypothetical protein